MSSPVRRAFELLRQHFLLLSGPWLGICAAAYVVTLIVQRILLRIYPLFNLRASHGAGYVTMNQAFADNMRTIYIRLAVGECVQILEGAFEVVALALLVLLVARVTTYGDDSFSAGLNRLGKVPNVTGNLLKFYAIALILKVGMALVGTLPVVILVPLRVWTHMAPGIPKWIGALTVDLLMLVFVLCVMPFFLNMVWRLLEPAFPDAEAPEGLLKRALGYAAVAVVAEIALRFLMGPLLRPVGVSAPTGISIQQGLIGLAINVVANVPTLVCVVAITLLVMDARQLVTEAEPA